MASREAALVALETLLKTIKTANGYALDVNYVTRQFDSYDQLSAGQFPALLIEDDGPEDIQWTTAGGADVYFETRIIGYVNTATTLATAINALDVELKKALYSDETFSGTIMHCTILPLLERSGSALNPYGYFIRPVRIGYRADSSAGL